MAGSIVRSNLCLYNAFLYEYEMKMYHFDEHLCIVKLCHT